MRRGIPTPQAGALLETARGLFVRHGIRRVRVEEICALARISKRTFYKHFRDRDDIAVMVLELLTSEGHRLLDETIGSDLPIEHKVRAIIAIGASPLAAASPELYHEVLSADSRPGQYARAQQREWEQRVREFYRVAQRRGEIRRDLDLDLLMALLPKVRDLLDDPALQQLHLDRATAAESVLKVLFCGILARPAASRRMSKPQRRSKP